MKCHEHRTSDAVAVCRYCGRGLCPDCIAEVDSISACKGRCETPVAALNAANARVQRFPFLSMAMGALFLLLGFGLIGDGPPMPFAKIAGGLMLCWGLFSLVTHRRRF